MCTQIAFHSQLFPKDLRNKLCILCFFSSASSEMWVRYASLCVCMCPVMYDTSSRFEQCRAEQLSIMTPFGWAPVSHKLTNNLCASLFGPQPQTLPSPPHFWNLHLHLHPLERWGSGRIWRMKKHFQRILEDWNYLKFLTAAENVFPFQLTLQATHAQKLNNKIG